MREFDFVIDRGKNAPNRLHPLLAALGFVINGLTFRAAGQHTKTHRDFPREDGTARYDDIWGG